MVRKQNDVRGSIEYRENDSLLPLTHSYYKNENTWYPSDERAAILLAE
jgi:hypothetical protein